MGRFVVTLLLSVFTTACTPEHQQTTRLPTDFHRGVNYAHIHHRGHGYGSEASATELANLHKLGVRWIAITPFGYQHGATADEIVGFDGGTEQKESPTRKDPSLTDRDLSNEVVAAHALGIKVTLKPHIWSNDFWDGKEWQGSIRQTSPEAHARWWASYRAFAMHYARFAEQSHVDMYCIGTELGLMAVDHPDEWRALIADIRKTYHGLLTYDGDWGSEFDRVAFWDQLDFIGISAYFPLNLPDDASVEQLVTAWKPHRDRIATLANQFKKPVIFLEVGYRAAKGSFRKPWTYSGGDPDPSVQARAYEALFEALHDEPWWKGAYFWKTFTDPKRVEERGDGGGFSFRGRPAESVIQKWYAEKK